MHPAKTPISLGIRPVWSESSLCAQLVAKDPRFLHADSKDSWSDWADGQADLSLRWAYTHFVGFVILRLIFQIFMLTLHCHLPSAGFITLSCITVATQPAAPLTENRLMWKQTLSENSKGQGR